MLYVVFLFGLGEYYEDVSEINPTAIHDDDYWIMKYFGVTVSAGVMCACAFSLEHGIMVIMGRLAKPN